MSQRRPPGLDGAIVTASNDYLIYWEHWADGADRSAGAIDGLRERVTVVLLQEARPTKIPADVELPYNGLEIRGGECLNVRFLRRGSTRVDPSTLPRSRPATGALSD